ncbi:MAG: class I SAM-dependent methyltransferase [Gemmatimonadota bacterium]
MSSPQQISHVSDTAHWVAVYRAMESERPDALFRDPYAKRLAGERGEAIVRALPRGRSWDWPMIVRTAVMDEILLRAIARDGVRTVVNLAAGLDARPYRLELPRTLRWIDVDLPAIQGYKRDALSGETARCALEWAPADLSDAAQRRDVLRHVAAGPGPALAITEGLLIYLESDQVAALARDLHGCSPLAWWLMDLATPRLLKLMARTWGKSVERSAPFRFAPPEGTAFFGPAGWREAEFRSMWEESLRLKRTMPLAGFWNLVGKLYPKKTREEMRRMSGIVLLGRADKGGMRP